MCALLMSQKNEVLKVIQEQGLEPANFSWVIGKYTTQEIIKEEDCEKLEFQAARWLNDFRRVLKEL